ncbi:hypothetical protein OHA77_11690 [Streptosporangium sp. NBC_01639]|uniref:hypothetical protein n=1 Tax=Streptosporangium sp. NBC_01639 TaxID=2975948 RepID=UPI003863093A|nr:hypothetical protein OHA77_11690 [Streptosporangium sp. NBC_01639]
MTNDEITWDVDGRQASGQRFRTLTDEQQQSHQGLRAQMGGGSPLPYPEFAGPYQEFIGALFGGSEELTAQWGRTGDGQALMAARNAQAEAANGGEGRP